MSEYGDCPRCTAPLGPKAWFCTKCGYQVEKDDPLVCAVCRTPMSMWDDTCLCCGARLEWPRVSLKSLEEADALRSPEDAPPKENAADAERSAASGPAAEASPPRKRRRRFWG